MDKLIQEFLVDREIYCRAASLDYYRENLQRFDVYLSGSGTPILDAAAYKDYIRYLRKQDVSTVTIATYSRAVKVFYKWLYLIKYIPEDYTAGVRLPRQDARIIEPLFADDVKVIRCYLDSTALAARNQAVFSLMLDCGLRKGEVAALTADSVDLTHRIIKVQHTKSRYPRVIPLPDNVAAQLSDADFFGAPVTHDAIKMLYQHIKNRTGITRCHAHLCRHTFATSFVAQGGNLEFLRLYLGHQDYATTQRYLHLAQLYAFNLQLLYKLDPVFFRTF